MFRLDRFEPGPECVPEAETLFLSALRPHARTTVGASLSRAGFEVSEPAPSVLAINLAPGELIGLVDELAEILDRVEIHDAWALLLPEGSSPSLADMARIRPLKSIVAQARGRWLHEILSNDRLVIHFQPIVRADDPTEVFAHECLIRGLGVDGALISPATLYEAARASDLMFSLDRAAKLRAIGSAGDAGLRGLVFINFNPSAVCDPSSCLPTILDEAAGSGLSPDRIVFEVVESDEAHPDLARIIGCYRDAGFRVALDDLGAGFASLNLLTSIRPDFIKLDMGLVRGVDRDPYKANILAKLLEMARKLDVGTVGEGVETEDECAWLQDHGVDYLQGYLIARPACPPMPPRLVAPRLASRLPASA